MCSNPNKADGTTCNDGNACTKSDVCTAGVCGGTAYTCSDGLACTADSCNGDGTCTFSVTAGNCLIGGACYAGGAGNPTNQCQQCTPSTSQAAWSAKTNGTKCDDGNPCTKGDTCQAGVCSGTADPVVPPATNVSINVTASLDASTGLAVDGQQVFPVPTSFTLPAVIPVIDGLAGMGTAVLSFHSATECIDVSCSYLGASSVPQAVILIDKLLGKMYRLQSCSDGSQANMVLSVTTIGLHVASGDTGTPQVVIQLLVSYPGGGNGPPSPDGGVPGLVGVPVPPAPTDDRGQPGSLAPPDYSKSKSNPLINGQFTPQADPGLVPLDPFAK